MKNELIGASRGFGLILVGALALSSLARAVEPTAFDLVKEGNRHVGEEAKDRVVKIVSEKSVASLTPTMWSVYYADRAAGDTSTEVRFAGGKMVVVKHHTGFLGISSKPKELPKEKLKVDSDRALQIAQSEPVLKNLKLTASRLILEPWEEQPVWKVRLWAAKLSKPEEMTEIGDLYINPDDGKVVRNNLKIQRVD